MTGKDTPLHGAHVSIRIGSLVQILTADQPRDPALRREGYECGIPVNIGEIIWIGSGAIILLGVPIGDDAIIGTGSVVTRDVAAGTPPSWAFRRGSAGRRDDLLVEGARRDPLVACCGLLLFS
jgi:hypothetical protein